MASGCAVASKGTTQTVTVRSVPAGATASINGVEVGQTPFRIALPRKDVHLIEVNKDGFHPQSTLIMPTPNEFEQRTLRWGIDYALGAMTDLSPADIVVSLRPVMAGQQADPFATMMRQVAEADELLANGQLSSEHHRIVVEKIVASYTR